MTANSSDFVVFIIEQLNDISGLSHGRFFGGDGLAVDGIQFAMLMGNTIYFVVNDLTRIQYEAIGSYCFSYSTKKGRVNVRKYYAVPASILENPVELTRWAKEAVCIAQQLSHSRPTKTMLKK
jgi:DNA transformation protein